ncbi:MAG: sigma 54-interacting transcriptional regulator [Planctomycetes bacterium]|nr:sigma 54-interacting transcriptional regulator [Planctomycetota bacterium]
MRQAHPTKSDPSDAAATATTTTHEPPRAGSIRVCLDERDPAIRRVVARACARVGLCPEFLTEARRSRHPMLVQMEALASRWQPPPGVAVLARRPPAMARLRLLAAGARSIIDVDSPDGRIADSIADVARAPDDAADGQPRFEHFESRAPAMLAVVDDARRLAAAQASVLITGETGVGKEHLARAVHAAGPRRDRPFVVVNCGALPESLLESQLFGHERGAFTGADRLHRGFFETAHGGTLLLDEIGEMPKHLQVALLTVLQRREVVRLGGTTPVPVDVRVMAATNRDLDADIAAGRFREDLFYRLDVIRLDLPPLRRRVEDLPELAGRMLRNLLARERRRDFGGLSEPALAAMCAYHWPGNLRELENVLQRAVVLGRGPVIDLHDLPSPLLERERAAGPGRGDVARAAAWDGMSLREAREAAIEACERAYLHRLLQQTNGGVGATAARAGVRPRSLYDKMRRYQLKKEDYRR